MTHTITLFNASQKIDPVHGEHEALEYVADSPTNDSTLSSLHWKLLIVDDEPDVHRATTFALNNVHILGRPLKFLHAYSAKEATELLKNTSDIAVILLDVVMEQEDAGLRLVKTIRHELCMLDIRIILRTGQPGYAPEIETIHDFDINNYKTKSELTRTKLYACVTAAIRTYEQINILDRFAYYDQLSQLPNRNRLISVLDTHLAHNDESQCMLALIDIDDFSEFNDALGHQQGDRLLQSVATRLKRNLSPHVVLARIGSDIFGLLGHEHDLEPHRLLNLFKEPFHVLEDGISVTATLGLVRLHDISGTGHEAIKDANVALKLAKKRRRGSFVIYDLDMGVAIKERVRLLQGLRSVIEAERLFVVYQPQVSLKTNAVVGMEALLRWKKDDGTFVPPDKFIPLAETSGLIVNIGNWVLRMACHELLKLQALGLASLRMSVNVSQIQFRHPDFISSLQAALTATNINPKYLELEITDSVAMEDADFMIETLNIIKSMGISIAIDDFGTGYSSLSQLRKLPVDRLKIDRAFVTELSDDMQGGHIAAMVIDLARNLNMTVIAEGIETEEQSRILRDMGCDEGQGYLYAKPLTEDALLEWLTNRDSF